MMTSSSIQRHFLPSAIDSLARVENIIEEIKEEYEISEEIYGNILVSLSEAVNNAIKHGNNYSNDKEITFSFDVTDKEYIFTITDQGSGFDFNDIPDPTHPDNLEKTDGRGIFIVKNLSDNVEFEDEGRTLKMFFNKI